MLESKFKEKLCSLSEAANLIKDGARIHFGGMSVNNHPMAFIYELIRKGIKDLTIVGHVSSMDADILVGAGCVKRMEISYVGMEEFGLAPNFRRAVEHGEIELVEYSESVCFKRFKRSAAGEPLFFTYEMIGTDLPKYNPEIKGDIWIMDVCRGLNEIKILKLDNFLERHPVTAHDFDIGMELKLLQATGQVGKVTVIAIPMEFTYDQVLEKLKTQRLI